MELLLTFFFSVCTVFFLLVLSAFESESSLPSSPEESHLMCFSG